MKRFLVIFIFTIFLCLSSCYEPIPGSGNVIKYPENFGTTINSITLNSIGNVFVTAGSTQEVEIEVDDNFIKDIKLEVNNKKLTIKTLRSIGPTVLNIYITIADIAELINSGSGKIIVQNNFNQGSSLFLTVSGSGNIEINNFSANDCIVTNTGSGSVITNSGNVNNGDYSLSGSGYINFASVINTEVVATNSGSGKILFTVTDVLDATITGSGNIEYWGNPIDVTHNITGSGKLIKRN